MENNKIHAIVDWYDERKGFGIARNNNIPLLLHSSYLNNKDSKIKAHDTISCTPVEKNGIYHATNIELVNKLGKNPEYVKK